MMIVLIIIVWLGLGIVLALRWSESTSVSQYELVRRSQSGDQAARDRLAHVRREPELESVRHIVVTLLSSTIVTLSVISFGRWPGIVIGTSLLITAPVLVRLRLTTRLADWARQKTYMPALRLVNHAHAAFRALRPRDNVHHKARVYSKPELLDIVHYSRGVLSDDEENRLEAALTFDEQKVSDIMTPRRNLATADAHDTLGPLVLHDLHSSGHDTFPVIESDIDHVVGILYLQEHTDVRAQPKTVREAMHETVVFIDQNQSVREAMQRLVASRAGLLIVTDEHGHTLGLVSLYDIIRTLSGEMLPRSAPHSSNESSRTS